MIHFISKKQHEVIDEEHELVVKSEVSQDDLDFITNIHILGFDYEATGLDPYIAEPLLMVLGNDIDQFVIDCTTIDCPAILALLPKDQIIIGANLKYDYKLAKVKHNHTFIKMFDVMIAEQRLVQGVTEFNMKKNRVMPISCSLESIILRRLGMLPNGMDKSITKEFIGVNPNTFVFKNKHIKYAAADIKSLYKIKDIQKESISKRNLNFLIYGIEFPAISVIADAELEGFIIDEVKWKENIKHNKEQKFIYQCKLDNELKRLRDTLLSPKERIHLSNGGYDRERKEAVEVIQGNMFGDMFDEIPTVASSGKKKYKAKPKEAYINWSSPDRLVYIFGRLKQPLPTKEGTFAVPKFMYDAKAKKDKIVKEGFTTGAGAIESYLTECPNVPIKDFVNLLITYREFNTRLNTFGESFLTNYKNPITKRFHTTYRQCDSLTGRLQSGDSKEGWFNSQNIPAEKRYREAFGVANGYSVCTTDLSGAEAVIMIDKAKDEKFYDIAILKDDAHSPLATAVWRAIGQHRYSQGSKVIQKWKKDDGTEITKDCFELMNIVISKKENKEIRTEFKNTTFASIYGCYAKKYAKMLNISIEEAKIALAVMHKMIPKTFKMVEASSSFALENGYLILNYRTSSRIWYPAVITAKKNNSDIPFREASDIGGSARNAPIQGTQADMVKEMMVEISREIKRQRLDAQLLIQVHDELVYKFNNNIQLVEFINDVTEVVELIPFPEFVKKWMCQVANRYLSFIKMTAEQHTGLTWTK